MSETTNGRSGKRTLIDEGTELKGSVKSTCPVVVMGRVEGDVSGPSVEIAEKGTVIGTVKAGQFASHGEMFGEIEADSVELSGKIRDGTVIRARSLDIKVKGQAPREPIEFGDCELCIGDEPNKAAAIARATAANQEAEGGGEARQARRKEPTSGLQQEPAAK